MNPMKPTHADVLKNASFYLNSSLPVRLVPIAPKTRLSDEGLTKLRSFINEKPNPTAMKSEKRTKSAKGNREVREESEPKTTQPLILATASDWVVRGNVVSSAIYDKDVREVRMLKSEEIGSVVMEGRMENPIEVCDDSDEEKLKCDDSLVNVDNYSVDVMTQIDSAPDFDADVVFASGSEIFESIKKERVINEKSKQKTPEWDTPLRLITTDEVRRAKRKMEYAFMNDYSSKMKPFKRVDRPEFEGEYTFTVRVAVDDNNTVEVRDAMTVCKLRKVEDESQKSEEEEYTPELESDVYDKRRRKNKEALLFDPEKQITKYNTKSVPAVIPVIEISEKASETCEYHWLSKYKSIQSNTQFNRFLNKFKNGAFAPKIASFEGVRYRALRVGTSANLNTVRQYNQFVIGNNFTIFRLGMNGSPNVDIDVSANAREKRIPLPINKKFTIASLFWANGLLKTQKAW